MQRALYDPDSGYYTRAEHPASDHSGDYITGSSLSPAFAEVIANFAETACSKSANLHFVDVGCGSGRFLRNLRTYLSPEWTLTGIDLHLPEFLPEGAKHITDVEALSSVLGMIFSYELFDALPCHVLQYLNGAWQELYVKQEENGPEWSPGPPTRDDLLDYLNRFGVTGGEGQIVEVCLEAEPLYISLASRLTEGFLLTFDYGRRADLLYNPDIFPGGTLMAYRKHTMHRDILKNPGTQDLTYAVNLTALEEAGRKTGLETVFQGTQARFLVENGIAKIDERTKEDSREKSALRNLFLGSMGQDIRVLIQKRKDAPATGVRE